MYVSFNLNSDLIKQWIGSKSILLKLIRLRSSLWSWLQRRMTIHNELKFKKLNEFYRKVSYKLHAPQRIRKYLSFDKEKVTC